MAIHETLKREGEKAAAPKKRTAPKESKPVNNNTFAVVLTGGKQYIVSEGATLSVEKLPKKEGEKVIFDKVLLFDNGKETVVGAPYIAGAKVEATVEKTGKGKKVTMVKFKSKTRYRVRRGHRQPYSQVKITSLSAK